jgi:DNA-sulfur modification-associated
MHQRTGELPTPLATLDELAEAGDSSERPYKAFIGHNLGNRTFLSIIPMHEFFTISEVANDIARDGDSLAQRKLDPAHAQKLAIYLLKGLVAAAKEYRSNRKLPENLTLDTILNRLGRQPYLSMQPIVVNIRNCDPGGSNIRGDRLSTKYDETACFKVFLSQKHVLWVVDGQHRRKAMELVFSFLDGVRSTGNYPKKGSLYESESTVLSSDEISAWDECFAVARGYATVVVEVHLGLKSDEERQLFHDLNNLGKKVETSLALQFDNSNPINLFIKDELIKGLGMKAVEKDILDWHNDSGAISRKDLVAVNAILFLNKTNIGGATPPMVTPKVEIARRFWEAIDAIDGFGETSAKEKTIAAQSVVLKALAKLVYDFAFSPRRDPETCDQNLEKLLSGISDIDFSHSNRIWRYYELAAEQREDPTFAQLQTYLPTNTDGANRDVGSSQTGFMRFGSKHNDIYPLLGDMIRFSLGLPPRQHRG